MADENSVREWMDKWYKERQANTNLIEWLAFKMCQFQKLSKGMALLVAAGMAHNKPDWDKIDD